MKTNIKWGIIGTSQISETMANAIHDSATSELIAIGSRSLEKAQSFANKFSIPKAYDDYQKLLQDSEIDVIYIGLPNHLHKEWIMRCAEAGKNILCEKPFVVSADEAREAIFAVKKSKVFCMEALMHRSHPFTQKIQELIQSKIIGDVKLYNATYTAHIADVANTMAGGSIRNLGCYPISLVRMLANAEPIEICGSGRFNSETNTDNQASVILKFGDNSMAVVSTADDMKMSWQFNVYGTKGILKAITNPWLPGRDNNQLHIYLNNEKVPREINVSAEKSLYTYQIDLMNKQVINKAISKFSTETLLDSLGNTVLLEKWLQQVKMSQNLECAF